MSERQIKFGRIFLIGEAVDMPGKGGLMGTGIPKIWKVGGMARRWIGYAKGEGLEGGEGKVVKVAIVEVLE